MIQPPNIDKQTHASFISLLQIARTCMLDTTQHTLEPLFLKSHAKVIDVKIFPGNS